VPTIAFATCDLLPELDLDDVPLARALEERGVAVKVAPWQQLAARGAADLVLLRSCWDYHLHTAAFLAWIAELEDAAVPLLNPPAVVRWNHDKHYLLDLAEHGLRIPETLVVERGSELDLERVMRERDWSEVVVKPTVSMSAHRTHRIAMPRTQQVRGLPPHTHDDLRALVRDGDVLVQEFAPEILSDGEWSFVFCDGAFSHAVTKRPAAGDFRVQHEFGGALHLAEATTAQIEQARRALRAAPQPCLYCRVDAIFRGGELLIMEIEAIDPQLYLRADDGTAARRFAAALDARLRALGDQRRD